MATQQVEIGLGVVAGSMNGITTAMVGMNELVSTVDQATMRFAQAFGDVDIAIVSLAAALGAVQFKAMEAFGEFERGMSIVQAVSGSTATEIGILGDAANQMSVKFNTGISDVTDGLATLGRAGVGTATQQIEILDQGFKMAKVSGDSLATTLENIVQMTSVLGGDMNGPNFTEQTEQVSNLITATSLSGPLTVKDVVQTLQFSGGTAAAGGANVNDMDKLQNYMGTIATFAQKGVTGSMAGTALRAFFTKPASQDTQVTEGLSAIGLSPYSLWEDGGNKMKDVSEQIAIIKHHMKGLSEMDQINIWGKIVGPKMGQQMMKLDAEDIINTTNKIKQQTSLDELSEQAMSGFSTSLEKLKKQFEVFFRGIGENSAKTLTPILQFLTKIMEILSNPIITAGLGIGMTSFTAILALKALPLARELKNVINGAYHSLTDKYAQDSRLMTGYTDAKGNKHIIPYGKISGENSMYADPKTGMLKSSYMMKGLRGDSTEDGKEILNLSRMSDADRLKQYNLHGAETEKIINKLSADSKKLNEEAKKMLHGDSSDNRYILDKKTAQQYLDTQQITSPSTLRRINKDQIMNANGAFNKAGYNPFLNDLVENELKSNNFGDLEVSPSARAAFRKSIGKKLNSVLGKEAYKEITDEMGTDREVLNANQKKINTQSGRFIYDFNKFNQKMDKINNKTLEMLSNTDKNIALQKAINYQKGFDKDGISKDEKKYEHHANIQNQIAASTKASAERAAKATNGFGTSVNNIQKRLTGFENFSHGFLEQTKNQLEGIKKSTSETMNSLRTQIGYFKKGWNQGGGLALDNGLVGAVVRQYQGWSNKVNVLSDKTIMARSPADGLSRPATPITFNKDAPAAQKTGKVLSSIVSSMGAFEIGMMAATAAITMYTMALQEYQKKLSNAQSEYDAATSKYSSAWTYFDEKFKEENPEYESELDVIENRVNVYYDNLEKKAEDYYNKTTKYMTDKEKEEYNKSRTEEDKEGEELYKNTLALYKATAEVRNASALLAQQMTDDVFGYDGGATKVYENFQDLYVGDPKTWAGLEVIYGLLNYFLNPSMGTSIITDGINRSKTAEQNKDVPDRTEYDTKYSDDTGGWNYSDTIRDYKLSDSASALLQMSKQGSDWQNMLGYGKGGTYGNSARSIMTKTNTAYFNGLHSDLQGMNQKDVAKASQFMNKDPTRFAYHAKLLRDYRKNPTKELEKKIERSTRELNKTMGTNFSISQMNQLAEIQQLSDIRTLGESKVLPYMQEQIAMVQLTDQNNLAATNGTTGQESATTSQVAAIASMLGAMLMNEAFENAINAYGRTEEGAGLSHEEKEKHITELNKDKNQETWSDADKEVMYQAYGPLMAYVKGQSSWSQTDQQNFMDWAIETQGAENWGGVQDVLQNRLSQKAAETLDAEIAGGGLDRIHDDQGSGGGRGGGGGKGSGSGNDKDSGSKKSRVDLVLCNKKEIPKLNVNLFKKEPTFTVLNKNFKMGDMKINTQDSPKSIMNSVKNAIISTQERMDPKIIRSEEGKYDPVAATDGTQTPSGSNTTN